MPWDFSEVSFGCLRTSGRTKAFRRMEVGAAPIPEHWPRPDFPIVMGRNDTLGTCVPTAVLNAIAPILWTRGRVEPIPDDLAVDLYKSPGPYRGTPETDLGMDPLVLFDWWRSNAILGTRLKSWADVDHQNEAMVRHVVQANYSIFGVQALRTPQQTQKVWQPVGGVEEGLHATSYNRFVGPQMSCCTWGDEQPVDQDFISGKSCQVLDMYALDIVVG